MNSCWSNQYLVASPASENFKEPFTDMIIVITEIIVIIDSVIIELDIDPGFIH